MDLRRKLLTILYIIIALITIGCSIEPEPIKYGIDNCTYCEMTIVDDKHSSELITTKGKVYKFDAIECMIRNIHSNPDKEYKYILIADLDNPGELINAKSSYFLISENMPSPMGENLSGFSTESVVNDYKNTHGGYIYSWQEINIFFKSK